TVQVSSLVGGPSNLTNVNGTLFFSATDGSTGYELWKTDGTEAGTVLVKDINTIGYSYPRNLTNVNGTLFFSADDGTSGRALSMSYSTATGTSLGKHIYPGTPPGYDAYGNDSVVPNRSDPCNLTNVNGTLFFAADDGVHGAELWKSDGTAAGTTLLKDIN